MLDSATASYLEQPLPTLSQRQLIPFIACGDLSGWDADQSYQLPEEGYVTLAPVAPPTDPAYKFAKQMQVAGHGAVASGDLDPSASGDRIPLKL